MFSVFVRQALAHRSAFNTLANVVGRLPTLSSSTATIPSLVVAARPRFFSLSAPLAFPTTKKKTTKKATPTTGRKTPTKTSTATKKKKTASTASKSKTKARKPPPKKKVVKKKIVVAKRKKVVAKKVVPKVETPRNTPRLRPPPRQMPAFGIYFQRMYPTLSPKPADVKEAFILVRNMWGALSDTEKEEFRSEARDISAQRKLVYDKWRHGLSQSDVQVINKYRKTATKTHKPRGKLGPDVLSSTKRRLNGFLKFSMEMRSTGQIDSSVAPEGVNKTTWFAKLAGARWRAMSDAEKKVYK